MKAAGLQKKPQILPYQRTRQCPSFPIKEAGHIFCFSPSPFRIFFMIPGGRKKEQTKTSGDHPVSSRGHDDPYKSDQLAFEILDLPSVCVLLEHLLRFTES